MKWAIALSCGSGCMFWNGFVFQNSEGEAAVFARQDLAKHAMRKIFGLGKLPEDPEDAEFKRRLYVQAVAP